MNKVFRVIWSQATQSWVAVSELTKAHKKQSSSTAKKVHPALQRTLLNLQPSHWHC